MCHPPYAALFLVLPLGLLALGAGGCATPLERLVLARVNDEPITVQDAQDAFESSHRGHGALLAGRDAVRDLVEKVVDKRLLLQEAQRIGLDRHPELDAAIRDFSARRGREELFKNEVVNKVTVTDEAIQAAHAKMRLRFRARQILVETRGEAEEAVARLRAGAAFGQVANEVSLAPSARKGGDLGLVTWGQLDPVLEARLERMAQGELSEPIETEGGWNILLVEERREADPPELARVRTRIVATLKQRGQLARANAYAQELGARWKAVRHDALITEEHFLRGPYPADREQADGAVAVAEFTGERIALAEFRRGLNLDGLARMKPAIALRVIHLQLEQEVNERLLTKEAGRLRYAEREPIATEVRRIRDDFAVNRLLGEVVFAKVSAAEGEARAYYEGHLQAFTDPEQVKVSLIRVEGEEEAREILAALQTGQDFAALARTRSTDASTARLGGELGWVMRGRWDPDLERAASALAIGQTGVAKGASGYYVLRLDARRNAVLQPFARVQEKATEAALRQKQREELKRWVKRLREASIIVVDQDAIARAVASYEAQVKEKMEEAKKKEEGKQTKEGKADQDGS